MAEDSLVAVLLAAGTQLVAATAYTAVACTEACSGTWARMVWTPDTCVEWRVVESQQADDTSF